MAGFMKVRTVYLKVADMAAAVRFWSELLGILPHKRSSEWSEFRCENINFGLLHMEGFSNAPDAANAVPVFELSETERDRLKERTLALGGRLIVDLPDHPDGVSYVLADPFGNEFEITSFSG